MPEEHNLKSTDESGARISVRRIVDAAEFSSGGSVALVDHCDGGACTISIVAMNLEDGRPVLSRFRNANGQDERVELASGSSVMHNRICGARLYPGKLFLRLRAIVSELYDSTRTSGGK